jgi:uncharacterized delta-60 repeat protein
MRGRRARWIAVPLTVMAALLPAPTAGAAAVGLSPAFGQDGVYRLDLTEPSLDVANAAVSAYGNPVFAGSAGGRFAVAGGGPQDFNGPYHQLLFDFGRPAAAHAGTIAGEQMFAAGRAGDDFAVAAFSQYGMPTLSFGDQGRVRTSFGAPAVAYGVEPMAPGAGSLAVGTVQAGTGSSMAMARYLDSGALDPTFGTGGKVVADLTAGDDSANAVVVTGPITVAGQAGADVLLARYLSDGTPDPAFGTGGRAVFSVTPGNDVAHALQISDKGDIFVSGVADGQAFLGRFSSTGAPVAGFGSGGVVRSALGAQSARFRAMRLNPTGTILASGTATGAAGEDAVIARFGPDGTLDPTFGTGGRTVVDLGGRLDQSNALVNGPGGQGLWLVGGDGVDMVAAAVTAEGSAGSPVLTKVDFGAPTSERAEAVAVLPDGRSVVAGAGTRGIILTRLLATGQPDPGFGNGGTSVTPILASVSGVAVVGEHILVLAAVLRDGWMVFRFSASGTLDPSYGRYGVASTASATGRRADMVATPDGRVVVGTGGSVTRLSTAGEIEARFFTAEWGGPMVGLAVQPDGKIVTLSQGVTNAGVYLSRFHPDGRLDDSFQTGGRLVGTPVVADPSDLLQLADGRFVVGARITTLSSGPPADPDLVLARFGADGSLDTTFGAGGVTRTPFDSWHALLSLHEQSDHRIVAVFSRSDSEEVIGVARYLPGGGTDTAFGAGGITTAAGVYPVAGAPTGTGDILVAGGIGADLGVARVLVPDPDPAGSYHPVAPVRLLDTRAGVGSTAAPLGPASVRAMQITGRGGVPSTGVTAVVLNVTVTEPTQTSFLTAWPDGPSRPLVSNLNFGAAVTVANMVVVKVGDGGRVNLYNHSGSTHVVADLAGWYGRGGAGGRSGYTTLPPTRILDTRIALGAPAARVGGGSTVALQVGGRGGVPGAGVSAVVLNVTATDSTWGSYLTAWPDGAARPLASNLKWGAGQTVPNLVVVKVGANGVVNLYNNQGSVHLVADVAGWYGSGGVGGGAMYSPVAPARLYDSREVQAGAGAKVGTESAVGFRVTGLGGVPISGVAAVAVNVTAADPTAVSFLTVYPSGTSRPMASNLNYTAGQTVPNLVVVKVGMDGGIALYNHSGSVHVIVDVAGWFAG